MIKLKNSKDKELLAFLVCDVEGCSIESEKIWGGLETKVIDVCLNHYNELLKEWYI